MFKMSASCACCVVPQIPTVNVDDAQFDAVVVVTDSIEKLTGNLEVLKPVLESYPQVDGICETVLVHTHAVPSDRLVFSPTGPLCCDQDDVRRFADAAISGINRAVKAGSKKPLLICPFDDRFPTAGSVATIAALHAVYVPLEIRELSSCHDQKIDQLGVWCSDLEQAKLDIEVNTALEWGRMVARDIGGSDPERMAAPRVEEYVRDVFMDTCIKVHVISDVDTLTKDYPLLAAVNRAARLVERHQGRVIQLEYEGEGPIDTTLFLVGKGITYDTGGADIKAGGIMAGMHRDKCGAAAVAGFLKVLSVFKPKRLKVIGAMAVVRNSVGSEGYVADEIIKSRAGVYVRVVNTDAEGRMVMADVLCHMKEKALNEVNPQLFTIATLTSHAVISMGEDYSVIMDNGPARKDNIAQTIQAAGEQMGDPFEISTIRREDYDLAKGPSEYEDILQCNWVSSSRTQRGHQLPAAFMILASGLDKHGIDSQSPLKYSHIDIAGSSGPFPGIPTGAPIVALATHYVLNRESGIKP